EAMPPTLPHRDWKD
nr:Chain P, 14-mer peptide from Peroxisomal membrane protein PEX141N5Z_Q Chain Q, 14-mer peptide from Peroxisomal membrane protein PEX14